MSKRPLAAAADKTAPKKRGGPAKTAQLAKALRATQGGASAGVPAQAASAAMPAPIARTCD